jgi:hypothetical protein
VAAARGNVEDLNSEPKCTERKTRPARLLTQTKELNENRPQGKTGIHPDPTRKNNKNCTAQSKSKKLFFSSNRLQLKNTEIIALAFSFNY